MTEYFFITKLYFDKISSFYYQMHLVHADETVTYDRALTEPFGLVVVSVLFQFGESSGEMKKLTDHLKRIKDPIKSLCVN